MATSADAPRRPNDRGGEKRERALAGPSPRKEEISEDWEGGYVNG